MYLAYDRRRGLKLAVRVLSPALPAESANVGTAATSGSSVHAEVAVAIRRVRGMAGCFYHRAGMTTAEAAARPPVAEATSTSTVVLLQALTRARHPDGD